MSHSKVLGLGLQLINRGGWGRKVVHNSTCNRAERNPTFQERNYCKLPTYCTGHMWPTLGHHPLAQCRRHLSPEPFSAQSGQEIRCEAGLEVLPFSPPAGISGHCGAPGAKEQNQKACGIGLSGESPLLPFQGRLQPAPNLVFPQLLGPLPTA